MEKIAVIKIGGNVVDNTTLLDSFLQSLSKIEYSFILVHGGGKIATQIGRKMGIEPNIVDGRRITDRDTIDLVTMVYAGLVNKKIVAKLQMLGKNAIGLTGADANVIRSHKRPVKEIDYGFVGDIDNVNSDLLDQLISTNYLPVMVPITHDGKGQLLNTNADTIASEVAISLSSIYNTELIYCFELPGVMKDMNDNDSVINQVNFLSYEELKKEGIISAGMIPKIDNCFSSINRGVHSVRICHADNLLGKTGTTFVK